MLVISDNFKIAMTNPIKELNAYIMLDETTKLTSADDLISFKLSCDSGLCKTAMRKLEASYLGDRDLLGKWVKVGFGVRISDGSFEYLDYGSFLISEIKFTKDTNTTEIIGYDKMINSMVEYSKIEINYPINLFDYTKAICEKINLVLGNESLNNGNLPINEDLWVNINGTTYRDILTQIAQATGTTCIISNDDKIYFKDLLNTNEILTYENLLTLKLQPIYGPINSIVLSRTPQEDNIYLKDNESINLNGLTEIKIENNEIVDDDRENAIIPIYDKLNGINYYPFEASTEGLGWFEIGDSFLIENDIGDQFNVALFNFSITIDGGITEVLKATENNKTQTQYQYATSISKKMVDTQLKVDKQNQIIEGIVEEVDGQNQKITQVTQTVDEINQKVSNIADLTITGESYRNLLTMSNIFGGMPLNIKIYPIGQSISLLYPRLNLYPSEDLYMTTRILKFKNTKTNEEFSYELPDDLLYLNNEVYDIFELDYENGICQITKKCAYNADGTVYQLENKKIDNYEIPNIELTEGNYTIYIENYDLAYISCKLAAKNDYTNIFATKVELNSSIKQTSEEINLEVSKKIANDDGGIELASLISQTAELIFLKANNFGWESKNSSMTTDGDLTARNATLNNANIVGGKITLTDGAQIVGDDGLIVNLQFIGFTRSAYELGGGTYLPVGHLGTAAATANVDKLNDMIITYKIPENFIVQSARVILAHAPITWKIYSDGSTIKGYSRNLKLYKVNNSNVSYDLVDYDIQLNTNVSEISNAFGANGFTGNENNTTFATSTDIKNQLSTNSVGQLSIRTSEGISNNTNYIFSHTGGVFGYLEVIGYKKF